MVLISFWLATYQGSVNGKPLGRLPCMRCHVQGTILPVDFTKCGPYSNEMRLSVSVSISHVQIPKKVSEGKSVGYF